MNQLWKPYQKEIQKLQATPRKMPTTRKARSYPERDGVHIPLVNWFRSNYPKYEKCIIHFAGERKCTPQYGALLRAMGVQAGISDLFISVPTAKYPGLWLELKAPGGKPSALQYAWIKLMIEMGYCAMWTDNLAVAKTILTDYMSDVINIR